MTLSDRPDHESAEHIVEPGSHEALLIIDELLGDLDTNQDPSATHNLVDQIRELLPERPH
ncbi:MAG: hypothetical protein LBG99_05250 [Propionibacteriaceae bacterium]|jgi:hypothetical protein|nr:hypothetical protein [Propionibacteriaceae bacterium]